MLSEGTGSMITFDGAFEEYIEPKNHMEVNTIRNDATAKNYNFEFQRKAGYKIT